MGGWVGEKFRWVKITGRGGVILVEDGTTTSGFVDIPGGSDGLKIKVTRNSAGGEAEVIITNSFKRRIARESRGFHKQNEKITMRTGNSFYYGSRVDDPDFQAI